MTHLSSPSPAHRDDSSRAGSQPREHATSPRPAGGRTTSPEECQHYGDGHRTWWQPALHSLRDPALVPARVLALEDGWITFQPEGMEVMCWWYHDAERLESELRPLGRCDHPLPEDDDLPGCGFMDDGHLFSPTHSVLRINKHLPITRATQASPCRGGASNARTARTAAEVEALIAGCNEAGPGEQVFGMISPEALRAFLEHRARRRPADEGEA